VRTGADAYDRYRVRVEEMYQSLRIVEQTLTRLEASVGEPVMVTDKKIGWPAQMSVGGDGLGNSLEHIREIMGTSMEALIHHFKLVTEGFRVPPGQAYVPIESPKGELGAHVVSDGGTRPFRAHFRDPSFNNLQAVAAMSEGGMIADVIVAVASIDPVMGGVDQGALPGRRRGGVPRRRGADHRPLPAEAFGAAADAAPRAVRRRIHHRPRPGPVRRTARPDHR